MHALETIPSRIAAQSHHLVHQNLTYWKDPPKLSQRIARQCLDLMEFDIEICHLPGRANGRADALSRQPDYNMGTCDNKNIVIILEHVMV